MTNTIGGIDCDLVDGDSDSRKQRARTWQTPGFDGVGAQQLGSSDGGFQFKAVKYDTEENVESWLASIEALQASIVTVVDGIPRTHENLFVEKVERKKKAVIHEGGSKFRGQVMLSGRVLE